jgi:hypothetical protein
MVMTSALACSRPVLAVLAMLAMHAGVWAASEEFCAQYAPRAVAQYQLMISRPQCRVPNGPRWQGNYNNHLNGCRAGPQSHLEDEIDARENHLIACGAVPPPPATAMAPAGLPEPAPVPIDPQGVPLGFQECDGNQCDHGGGGIWIFHGQSGEARWPDGAIAKLTIERFDAGGVVIRRIDTTNSGSPGFTALYTGTARNGRYEGRVDAYWPGHFPKGKPPGMVHYTWFATVPQTACDAKAGLSAPEALETGQTAVRFRRAADGFGCFGIAAGQAKSLLGIMYRDGIGTEVNYPEAFRWLEAGAIQGEYNAQVALSQMYDVGIGTRPDPKMAQTWKEQAYNNPVMVRQRQQAKQQEQAQQLMFMGFAAVLDAMTRPDVVVVY